MSLYNNKRYVGQHAKKSYFNLLICKHFIYFSKAISFALHYRYNTRPISTRNQQSTEI